MGRAATQALGARGRLTWRTLCADIQGKVLMDRWTPPKKGVQAASGHRCVAELGEENGRADSFGERLVVPCYNEQEVLRECHTQLSEALEASCGASYELIYVNDGSKDGTEEILRALHASSPQVRAIMLSRNFGHQAAVTAGLAGSTGRCAIIIDADLQDPPEVIPQMLDRWRQGFEVVYGVRESREGESGFKIRSAQLFYRLINRLSNIEIPLDSGDFRLLDRRAIDALLSMPERHRLLRGMSSWIGFRQFGLRYARAARFAGATKYPINKMLGLALDGILSF